MGLAFSRESVKAPSAALRRRLPLGTTLELRSSKKVETLPHGLGELSSRSFAVVDVDFARGWYEALLRGPRLVAQMLGALDLRVGGAHTPRARLFWLPPGQAGSRVADLGDAKWIARLKTARWVPTVAVAGGAGAAAPGVGAGSASRRELRSPRDVALRRTQSNRHLPLASLPANFLSSKLAQLLAFGTAPAPSPMARLARLAEAAARGGDRAPSGALAAETWRDVARGALTFTPEEVRPRFARRALAVPRAPSPAPRRAQPAAASDASTRCWRRPPPTAISPEPPSPAAHRAAPPTAPQTQRAKARAFASRAALLPAADGIALVKSERCVRTPTSALAVALCACGYFVDLAAPSHALADVATPLCELLGLAPSPPAPRAHSEHVVDGDGAATQTTRDLDFSRLTKPFLRWVRFSALLFALFFCLLTFLLLLPTARRRSRAAARGRRIRRGARCTRARAARAAARRRHATATGARRVAALRPTRRRLRLRVAPPGESCQGALLRRRRRLAARAAPRPARAPRLPGARRPQPPGKCDGPGRDRRVARAASFRPPRVFNRRGSGRHAHRPAARERRAASSAHAARRKTRWREHLRLPREAARAPLHAPRRRRGSELRRA